MNCFLCWVVSSLRSTIDVVTPCAVPFLLVATALAFFIAYLIEDSSQYTFRVIAAREEWNVEAKAALCRRAGRAYALLAALLLLCANVHRLLTFLRQGVGTASASRRRGRSSVVCTPTGASSSTASSSRVSGGRLCPWRALHRWRLCDRLFHRLVPRGQRGAAAAGVERFIDAKEEEEMEVLLPGGSPVGAVYYAYDQRAGYRHKLRSPATCRTEQPMVQRRSLFSPEIAVPKSRRYHDGGPGTPPPPGQSCAASSGGPNVTVEGEEIDEILFFSPLSEERQTRAHAELRSPVAWMSPTSSGDSRGVDQSLLPPTANAVSSSGTFNALRGRGGQRTQETGTGWSLTFPSAARSSELPERRHKKRID